MNKMNIDVFEKVEQLKNEGYQFEFSKYISEAYEIVRQDVGKFIAYTMIIFLIQLVANVAPGASLVVGFIMYPLIAGYYIVGNKIDNKEPYKFDNFFDGFKFASPLIVSYLIMIGIIIICFIPSIIYLVITFQDIGSLGSLSSNPEDIIIFLLENVNFFVLFLLFIPLIYCSYIWLWTPYFIVFYNMKPWDAMESSRKVIQKKFLSFLGFSLILVFVAMLGLLCFLVGILVAYPVIILAQFVAFKTIFGLGDEEDENQDLLDHLLNEGFR